MAKGQRGNKEAKKPKRAQPSVTAPAAGGTAVPAVAVAVAPRPAGGGQRRRVGLSFGRTKHSGHGRAKGFIAQDEMSATKRVVRRHERGVARRGSGGWLATYWRLPKLSIGSMCARPAALQKKLIAPSREPPSATKACLR